MKKILTFIAASVIAMPFTAAIDTDSLQTVTPEPQMNSMNLRIDREATARLRELSQKQEELLNEYEVAAASRDSKIEGATSQTLEMFYTKQDSICMDIRSKIIDIQMQIDEIR